MNIIRDLDDYADYLAGTTGLECTRDPDLIHPPCLYLDLPEIVSPTLGAMGVEIPVHLIGGMAGKQAGDILLDWLPSVLDATGTGLAEPATLTIGGMSLSTYKITVPATITPTTAIPPSAPGVPVAVNWKRAEVGWYTFTLTWNPSADEGSSPIRYYRVNIEGNETPTPGNVTQVDNLRAQAGQTAYAFVVAVNSETVGPPSETSYLTAPPY